jgi:hypothetical protein
MTGCYDGDTLLSLWRLVFAESGYTGDIGNTGTGLPPRRATFDPRSVIVGIVMEKVAVVFLSTYRHVPWQCLKLYHKRFLPHPFQFIISPLFYLLTSYITSY